jgi:hypothetical protein
LPSLVESLDKPDYMNIQPLYQRRKRWDKEKKIKTDRIFFDRHSHSACHII